MRQFKKSDHLAIRVATVRVGAIRFTYTSTESAGAIVQSCSGLEGKGASMVLQVALPYHLTDLRTVNSIIIIFKLLLIIYR